MIPSDDHLTWFKSSRSSGNGACVMCAHASASVLVKDSKDPDGPVLTFDAQGWAAFVAALKAGQVHHPAH